MIKVLKLQKGVIAIVLGIVALIIAEIMRAKHLESSGYVLIISGVFLIIGALVLLYPILFAKKIDPDGAKVELQPAAKEPTDQEN
jgi:uncharacterized membrane protein HdeD (DUF308 family)